MALKTSQPIYFSLFLSSDIAPPFSKKTSPAQPSIWLVTWNHPGTRVLRLPKTQTTKMLYSSTLCFMYKAPTKLVPGADFSLFQETTIFQAVFPTDFKGTSLGWVSCSFFA